MILPSLYNRSRSSISFAVLLLLCSGCIRIGIPEFIAPVPARSGETVKLQTAILVVPQSSENYGILGHQYLFGVFPLTRLSLSRTGSEVVAEMCLDHLQNQDYVVYQASENDLPSLAQQVKADLIFKPTLIAAELNAFDAFLVRILKSEVTIRSEFYRNSGSAISTAGEQTVTRTKRQYRRYGFSPALAYLFGQTIREAVDEVLASRRSGRSRFTNSSVLNPEIVAQPPGPLLFVVAPTFENIPSPDFSEYLAGTKEFQVISRLGLEPFGVKQIARILQRAVADAFASENGRVVMVNGKQLNLALPSESGAWRVDTIIHRLDVSKADRGTIELDLSLVLSEGPRPLKSMVLLTKRSQLRSDQSSGHADSWLVALENMAHDMVRDFIGKLNGPSDLPGKDEGSDVLEDET